MDIVVAKIYPGLKIGIDRKRDVELCINDLEKYLDIIPLKLYSVITK